MWQGKETKSVIENRTFQSAVDQDWEYSRQNDIHAVPTFMIQGQKLVGAQNYEALAELLQSCGVEYRQTD